MSLPHSQSDSDAWTEDGHSVLNAAPPAQPNLHNYLQTGLPDPLEMLLSENREAASALLSDVVLEQAPPQPLAEEPTQTETPPVARSVMIEQDVALSRCKLWEMLISYYANQGINAWQNSVPNFITSSVYMAETYAECIMAFLTDHLDQLDFSEPVYILELATGTGRFSFHLLRELTRKLPNFKRFSQLQIRYVMSDFTDRNPEFWEANERLQPYAELGVLDFAVFNPLEEQSFTLRNSGETVDCSQLKNPLIAIANYFFDSTPMDVFLVRDQKLHEGLVSLERNLPDGVEADSAPHISQISTHFNFRELPDAQYYADTGWNAVLDSYRRHIPNGQVLFPLGAFEVVRNLKALSNDRLMLLSSDKGFTDPTQMISVGDHEFAVHDGTFSYMVNFDALGLAFHQQGGLYFATTNNNLSVQTACLMSDIAGDKRDCENIAYLFREKIDRQNPANSLCALVPGYEKLESRHLKLNSYLAQIRMHLADPFIFSGLAEPLAVAAGNSMWTCQRAELLRLLDMAMDNFYHCPGEGNLPFHVAPVYFLLGLPQKSLHYLQLSVSLFGEDALHHYLMGQCYDKMEESAMAMAHYERALVMRPEFPEVINAKRDLMERLNNAA